MTPPPPPPELPGEAMFGTIDCSHTTLQWAAHGAKGTVVRSEAEYAISLIFRITNIYLTYESESSQG